MQLYLEIEDSNYFRVELFDFAKSGRLAVLKAVHRTT